MLTQAHEILMAVTLPLTLDSFSFFPFFLSSAVKHSCHELWRCLFSYCLTVAVGSGWSQCD